MVEQVLEHPVLSNIGLEPGAVDDVVSGDRDRARLALALDHADDLAVAIDHHLVDGALHDLIPAFAAALVHLGLPRSSPWRAGAAHLLVPGRPVLAFQLAHLRLELAAPDRLRVVEALVGEAIGAL